MQSLIKILCFNNFFCSFVESCFILIKIKLVEESRHSKPWILEILFFKKLYSFLIIDFDFIRWDLFLIATIPASCARTFTLHGILIFCKISMNCFDATAYPILIPAKPKDLVRDLKTKRLSYLFIKFNTDWFDSGTNSIKHSSTNTIQDFCLAEEMILVNCFFYKIIPVGLFGLQIKIQPFSGI